MTTIKNYIKGEKMIRKLRTGGDIVGVDLGG